MMGNIVPFCKRFQCMKQNFKIWCGVNWTKRGNCELGFNLYLFSLRDHEPLTLDFVFLITFGCQDQNPPTHPVKNGLRPKMYHISLKFSASVRLRAANRCLMELTGLQLKILQSGRYGKTVLFKFYILSLFVKFSSMFLFKFPSRDFPMVFSFLRTHMK